MKWNEEKNGTIKNFITRKPKMVHLMCSRRQKRLLFLDFASIFLLFLFKKAKINGIWHNNRQSTTVNQPANEFMYHIWIDFAAPVVSYTWMLSYREIKIFCRHWKCSHSKGLFGVCMRLCIKYYYHWSLICWDRKQHV